jgi:LysM repeat protein
MGDREQGAQRAGASLLGSVIAVGGTIAMATAARALGATARGAHGEEQLIGWVLVVLAAAGALLCLYLAVIWALAATVLLAGPAGRTGRMLLPALRMLAPRLARRVSVGAAGAAAATGLVLGPALASELPPQGWEEHPGVSQTSQVLPGEISEPTDPSPTAPVPSAPAEPLPSLGWGGEPAPQGPAEPGADDGADGGPSGGASEDGLPAAPEDGRVPADAPYDESQGTAGDEEGSGENSPTDEETSEVSPAAEDGPAEDDAPQDDATEDDAAEDEAPQDDPPHDAATGPSPEAEGHTDPAPASSEGGDERTGGPSEDAPTARTVVVRQGDTLWSITDDLLGPAPEAPAELAATWPLLHEANRDVIGEDPDLLVPGQVLTVPAALDGEAVS